MTHLLHVGLDAADEEGVGDAEGGHQSMQGVLGDGSDKVKHNIILFI